VLYPEAGLVPDNVGLSLQAINESEPVRKSSEFQRILSPQILPPLGWAEQQSVKVGECEVRQKHRIKHRKIVICAKRIYFFKVEDEAALVPCRSLDLTDCRLYIHEGDLVLHSDIRLHWNDRREAGAYLTLLRELKFPLLQWRYYRQGRVAPLPSSAKDLFQPLSLALDLEWTPSLSPRWFSAKKALFKEGRLRGASGRICSMSF
jgi:hypothetical protein